MGKTTILRDKSFESKLDTYKPNVKPSITKLIKLIEEVAEKEPSINKLEQTLKWGEPSFITSKGSTLRLDWKEKSPEIVSLYFKCTSLLVPTFKTVYGPKFNYENNRAIQLKLNDNWPEEELKVCIKATLLYHKVKKQEHLGMA